MDKQQLPGYDRPLQQLDGQQIGSQTSRLPSLPDATTKRADHVARFPGSKENGSPTDDVPFGKSAYLKGRVPGRGILRKPEGSDLQTLQNKLESLQNDVNTFNAQKPAGRRDSLLGRGGAPAPLVPSAASGPADAPLRPAPSVLQFVQPLQHKPLTASHDAGGCQDDDVLTASHGVLAGSEPLVKLPVGFLSNTRVVSAAQDTFEDSSFKGLCVDVLNKGLTRTKDGATDQSRIRELADLVKQLRKCVREFGSRSTGYIEKCAMIERDYTQKVENINLASQTTCRELEAELASARSDLAKIQCDLINERVKLGADLDVQAAEVTRLLRDVERLTVERDHAREDAMRAEREHHQLDVRFKELQRTVNQQQREITVSQSEAVRLAMEQKTTAENQLASLRGDYNHQSARMATLEDCMQAVTETNRQLELALEDRERKLSSKETLASYHEQQAAKLKEELSRARLELSDASGQVQQLQQGLTCSDRERAELAAFITAQSAELDQMRSRAAAIENTLSEERHAWGRQRQDLEASLSALGDQHSSLAQEVVEAQAALSAVSKQKEVAESSAERLAFEKTALQRECAQLQHSVEFNDDRFKQMELEAAGLRRQVHALQAELEASHTLLGEKDARLEQLEGEFAALKEVLGESTSAEGASGKEIVTKLLSKIAALQHAAVEAEAVRRRLHNDLVDLRGNIRVYCRVKPHPTPATRLGPDGTSIALAVDGVEHLFRYDRVFGPESSQEQVFGTVSELVQSALDGFHVCVFSYGQTGAGKTHTMQGGSSAMSRGIIPRALEKILGTARKLEQEAEWLYTMEACFIEVYNQTLRDLLSQGAEIKENNAIKHDANGGHTVVSGAKVVGVNDLDSATELVRQAGEARAVVATAMNTASSRSHCVFMLNITGWHAATGTRLQGSLCLVDLAGSERLDRSQAEGAAKKEACHINTSLSALGDVFGALSSKTSHVPYRNSKLTYLLQPCLGGNGKTLMFVNVNPEPASAGESLCSLRFAAKVNGCETGAKGGARRNVQTLGGGGVGSSGAEPSGSRDPAGSRFSLGIPRLPGAGSEALSAAAAKRLSMAPQRPAVDAGASRMKGAKPGAGILGGLKRPGAGLPDIAAKRTKS